MRLFLLELGGSRVSGGSLEAVLPAAPPPSDAYRAQWLREERERRRQEERYEVDGQSGRPASEIQAMRFRVFFP